MVWHWSYIYHICISILGREDTIWVFWTRITLFWNVSCEAKIHCFHLVVLSSLKSENLFWCWRKNIRKMYFLKHIQLKWAACYLAYNDQVNVVCKAVIFLIDLTLRILEFLQWYQELGLVIFLFSLSKNSKKLFILPTDIHWVHTHTCMCLPAHMFTQTAYPCENRNLVFWCPLQKILRAKPFRPGK